MNKKSDQKSPLQEVCGFSRGVLATHLKRNGTFKKYKELPFNPRLKQRACELRKAGNVSEILFWKQVRNKKFLSLDFHRQKIIGNYIVDFYFPALDLVVEIDGGRHELKMEYDQKREEYLTSLGLHIVHFPDIEIKKNLCNVMEYLGEYCIKLLNSMNDRKKRTPRPPAGGHSSVRGEENHG